MNGSVSYGYRLLKCCYALAWLSILWVPAEAKVRHVIHISVDGLRGDLLESLVANSPSLYPGFLRFVDEGATTFNARTDFFSVETLPNHATMLTGRPVGRPAGAPATIHHGIMDNFEPGSTGTLHNLGNPNVPYIASTFDVAHDHGLSTAFYAEKDKFMLFDNSYNAVNGAADITGVDNGRDKIDLFTFAVLDLDPFLTNLSDQNFNYSFLHFTYTDGVGHNSGWGSPEWNAAVQYIDANLGHIFATVESDPEMAHDTVIILTADHGGSSTVQGMAPLLMPRITLSHSWFGERVSLQAVTFTI